MAITTTEAVLYLAAFMFCVGLVVVLTRRNLIMLLIGLELMLNAANVNLVAFQSNHPHPADGQMLMLFIILVAVCEAAVGIALVIRVYHFYRTSLPDRINELKERT